MIPDPAASLAGSITTCQAASGGVNAVFKFESIQSFVKYGQTASLPSPVGG